jgi:hypothetical protein
VVEKRPPTGELELALDQAREAVVSGPAIEEKPVQRHALANVRTKRPAAAFAKGKVNGVELMPAVAAALLLPRPSVHHRLPRRVAERVDGGIAHGLNGRIEHRTCGSCGHGTSAPPTPTAHGHGSRAPRMSSCSQRRLRNQRLNG